MWLLIKILLVVALINFTKSVEQTPLSESIVPINYKIQLKFKDDFPESKTVFGNVSITFAVKNNINYFPIHGKNIIINNISIHNDSNEIFPHYSEDVKNNFWEINCTENSLEENKNYTLSINYTGNLSETSIKGLYLNTYTDSEVKYVVSTQFKQFEARRAFPCFDEPALKSTFDISVTYPKIYSVLSNTNGKEEENDTSLQTINFETTPKLSTYSVALMVSQLNCTNSTNGKVKLCANKNLTFALDTAAAILETMSNYTNHDNDIPENTLTLAAIPDFAGRTGGGWDLKFFREGNLLWDESELSDYHKQQVVTSIANAVSHQWFGDMVTPESWSHILLTEGFATYFEYHIPKLIDTYKEWQLQKQFVIERLQTSLLTDSLNTSVPLSNNKAGSILRMVEYMLGSDKFKSGVGTYIRNNLFRSTTPKELWNSFGDVPEDWRIIGPTLSGIMKNWTENSGYPLLEVTTDGENVTISQQQFLLSGNGTNVWYVPITYILEERDFFNLTWLTPQDTNISLEGVLKEKNWIIVNNQQAGYYRVNYDKNLISNLSKALGDSVEKINDISRSQLVDDQLNLARAGIRTYSDVLGFIKFLEKDTSYYSWYPAFNAFDYLLQRIIDNTVKTAFENYIKSLMISLITSVSINVTKSDDHIYILNQVLAQTWACKLDNKKCVNYALTHFENYRTGKPKTVDRNLKSIVYCYGLRNSNNSTRDYEFLWKKYQETKLSTEQVTILKALGCVKDTLLIQNYLTQVLTDNIKIQDVKYVFSSITSNNDNGTYEVLNFLRSNFTELIEHFSDDITVLFYAISIVADTINNQQQIDMLNFLSGSFEEPLKAKIVKEVDKARRNLNFALYFQTTLKEYFEISNNAYIDNNHFILILVGYLLTN